MGNRTLPRRLAATIAAAVATVAGIGAHADAQELDDPVSYQVGALHVFGSRTRNESCSVTRNLHNTGDVPVRVLGTVTWPDHLAHVAPNQGSFDGDQVIAPGEQAVAVWTNHDYITDGPVDLGWSVMLDDPTAQIGATHLEQVPACHEPPSPDGPDTSLPSVPDEPPTDTVVPPATSTPTGPPPSTSVVSDPVEPPPTAPGPETTTTLPADTGVLTSSTQRTELAATGRNLDLVLIGGALTLAGILATGAAGMRRKLATDREGGAR